MVTIYRILVFIHIFSAIVGMGPGFTLLFVKRTAKSMTELRHSYQITRLLHRFVMIGGFLLLLSGILMGAINTGLFHQGWYVTSLILFLVGLAMGPLVLTPKVRPINDILKNYRGNDIPKEYLKLSKGVLRLEVLLDCIFIVIIILMIWKPF